MTSPASRPLLLGHRGARPLSRLNLLGRGADLPAENTLAAFDYALANGCDGFEFDVRYTADGRAVVCHDPSLNGCEIAIVDYSALQRTNRELACLEDVLTRFGARAYLNIELKVSGNEQEVVTRLRAIPPQRGFLVSSFLPEVLHQLHQLDATLPLGYICKRPEDLPRWTELPIVAFLPQYRLVSQRMIEEVHARGMKVLTWTVNDARQLLRLAAWGIDGLISDSPQLLSTTFPALQSARASAAY